VKRTREIKRVNICNYTHEIFAYASIRQRHMQIFTNTYVQIFTNTYVQIFTNTCNYTPEIYAYIHVCMYL